MMAPVLSTAGQQQHSSRLGISSNTEPTPFAPVTVSLPAVVAAPSLSIDSLAVRREFVEEATSLMRRADEESGKGVREEGEGPPPPPSEGSSGPTVISSISHPSLTPAPDGATGDPSPAVAPGTALGPWKLPEENRKSSAAGGGGGERVEAADRQAARIARLRSELGKISHMRTSLESIISPRKES
jgi:hypothetical protein